MPFLEELDRRGGLADGLTHDIITRLAKLRSLFVIARGSVFALAEQKIGPEEAGRRLKSIMSPAAPSVAKMAASS